MKNSWGVIGCATMAREYCRGLLAKGITPTVYSRELTSPNVAAFRAALPALEVRTLADIRSDVDHWLVCTNIESHEEVCRGLQGNIYCEKPYAHLPDYDATRDITILMNRRYYYWVDTIKGIIDSGRILKIIATIPERSVDALITQSIHVIDLLWYLAGPFQPATKTGTVSPSYLLSADTGLPLIINMNYGAHENFSLRFYADNGDVYEAKPLEAFSTAVGMEVREPDEDNPLRSYTPIINKLAYLPTNLKPGLGELIDDLLQGSAAKLPTLAEHREVHAWMQDNMV